MAEAAAEVEAEEAVAEEAVAEAVEVAAVEAEVEAAAAVVAEAVAAGRRRRRRRRRRRWRRRTICRDLDWVRLEHTARLAHERPEDVDLVVPDGQVVRAVEGVHGTLTRSGHDDPVMIEDGAVARDSGPTDPRHLPDDEIRRAAEDHRRRVLVSRRPGDVDLRVEHGPLGGHARTLDVRVIPRECRRRDRPRSRGN